MNEAVLRSFNGFVLHQAGSWCSSVLKMSEIMARTAMNMFHQRTSLWIWERVTSQKRSRVYVFLKRANQIFQVPERVCVPGTCKVHLKCPETLGQHRRTAPFEEYLLWAQQSRKGCEQSPSGLRGGQLEFLVFFSEVKMDIQWNQRWKSMEILWFPWFQI